MKLPNYEQVVITREKVADYLLSDAHRDGRHQAAFFKRFVFAVTEWENAARALQAHAAEHDVTRIEASPYGQRYVVEGHPFSRRESPFHPYHLVYRNGRGDAAVCDCLSCQEQHQ
jgi:hypothetical protein